MVFVCDKMAEPSMADITESTKAIICSEETINYSSFQRSFLMIKFYCKFSKFVEYCMFSYSITDSVVCFKSLICKVSCKNFLECQNLLQGDLKSPERKLKYLN